ncbi:uncharacterized ATP-dependent helicase Irc5p [Diutina catenulata]
MSLEAEVAALVQQQNDAAQHDEAQQTFNDLSKEQKLARLNMLIQRSQMFSSIIANTILETSLRKQTPPVTQQPSPEATPPPRKRTRSAAPPPKRAKKRQASIMDMLKSEAEIKPETRSARSALTDAQEGTTTSVQPVTVSGGTLKPYQLDGLQWMITLYENGLNGILADEMGLGKTVQCISFLSYLLENGIVGPFLVVVPLSTVSNWQREFARFAPSVSVARYGGTKAERAEIDLRKLAKKTNVIVTSYEMAIRDFTKFSEVTWKYMLVDEGHRLKNNECTLIRCLKQLPVSNRLLITGTPLQNNLDELWSLLNFILPDIFSDLHLFQQWFNFDELANFERGEDDAETKRIIKVEIQENLVKNLHTILKPFILRRLKRDVVKDLPPKMEYLVHVPMTALQQKLYCDCIGKRLRQSLEEVIIKQFIENNHKRVGGSKDIDAILESINHEDPGARVRNHDYREAESDDEFSENDGSEPESAPESREDAWQFNQRIAKLGKRKLVEAVQERARWLVRHQSLQNLMMQLRNIANSPYIYFDPIPVPETAKGRAQAETRFAKLLYENSGKFQVLDQLCNKLLAGHKVLIFSQFTRVLDLLQDWFAQKRLEVCRIDGSADQEERDAQISQFYNDPSHKIFLLSTRSGGLGINLVPADTVILFDSDWNPQMDLQAIDRVHRIGQKKPVKVVRFVTRNSIEEIMLTRSASKRFLEKLVIQMGEFKFNKLKKVMGGTELNDQAPINIQELLELSTLQFDSQTENEVTDYPETPGPVFKLSDEELAEILDRSPECYSDDTRDFKNVTVFETVNNMDK